MVMIQDDYNLTTVFQPRVEEHPSELIALIHSSIFLALLWSDHNLRATSLNQLLDGLLFHLVDVLSVVVLTILRGLAPPQLFVVLAVQATPLLR